MEKPRAVIYIRVSDEKQIQNNSLETQLSTCRHYIERKGWQMVEIFNEEGVSAKAVHNRPEMRRLLAFCTNKKNNIAQVVVYKMDRFSRNTEDGLVAISLLARHSTCLVSATEATEETPMGRAMRTILMTSAQLDNELKGVRMKDNMQTMFRKGLWCWKPPIGYVRMKDKDGTTRGQPLILDTKLAPILRQMFERAGSGYFSKISLANLMNQLGFEQFYGRKADGKLVTEILSKAFYYGYMYASKWKIYEWGKHEKLIEQDMWEKAYYNTFGNKRKMKHQDNNTYPLKGLIRCENCGHAMTSSNQKAEMVIIFTMSVTTKLVPRKKGLILMGHINNS